MHREPSSNPSAAAGKTDPLDWARIAGKVEPVRREIDAYVRRRRHKRLIVTGAAMVAIGAMIFVWREPPAPVRAPAGSHPVVTLPPRRVLPDGSVVELKDGAEIAVDYSGALRRVSLRKGEAHFQVAKNKNRPFVVEANGIEVRAVGTGFSVERRETAVEVIVTEGQVAVENRGSSSGAVEPAQDEPAAVVPLAVLDAGKRVLVSTARHTEPEAAPVVQSVPEIELSQRLGWRVPRLLFDATPLAEVIPAFNQYGHTRLTLANPEMGKLKLSGSLRADNVPALLTILESSYGLKPEHRANNEIVLHDVQPHEEP